MWLIVELLLTVDLSYFIIFQLLTGLTGSEPDEPVKDYIKKYYHLYSRGVYWFNATDELMLEASVKLANADITVS